MKGVTPSIQLKIWENTLMSIESGNHRIIKVGKYLQDHQVQPSIQYHHAC